MKQKNIFIKSDTSYVGENFFCFLRTKQTGITLIALIITIIILLILAGITINLTIGQDGIIRRAQEAGKNYLNAADYDNQQLGELTNTADKIIKNVTGEDITTSTENPNDQALATKTTPGDYVEYDGGNGYTGLWQVLYNDDIYGLQIISSESVGTLTLGGTTEDIAKQSYNNAIELLNTYCQNYINTKYAISARCVGSNPLNPEDMIKEIYTLHFTYNGSTVSGCKVGDTNYETDYNAMQLATSQSKDGIINVEQWYWLASREVNPWTSPTTGYKDVCFYIRRTGLDVQGEVWYLFYQTYENRSGAFERTCGVRPVISLAHDIKTNEGDGSKENPFKLVAQQ